MNKQKKTPATNAERVAKHAAARDIKRVPLDGVARGILETVQDSEGLSSRSDAIRYLNERNERLEGLDK